MLSSNSKLAEQGIVACLLLWGMILVSGFRDDQVVDISLPETTPRRRARIDGHSQQILQSSTRSGTEKHEANESSSYPPNSTLVEVMVLLQELMKVPSTSGSEGAIAEVLKRRLTKHGLTVELQPVRPSRRAHESRKVGGSEGERHRPRHNVFAYLPSHRRTPVLLTSHMDTVPPYIPYSERKNGQEIWGRGAVDAVASIATQFVAWNQLLSQGKIRPQDVAFLYVVGEETGGDGMAQANSLREEIQWKSVIFGEPTDNKLAAGHKGIMLLKLKAHGRGGHSGYPELADSAMDILLPALACLRELQLPWSEKYGNTTINIGRVEAGVAANVIAERAEADIGIRVATADPEVVKQIISTAIRELEPRVKLEFYGPCYGPVDLDTDVAGMETATFNYGTDVPNLRGQHHRYLYGPGSILVAHSDQEHIAIQNLVTAVDGYEEIILHAVATSRAI